MTAAQPEPDCRDGVNIALGMPQVETFPRHALGSKARVLLTSVFGPYAQDDEFGSRTINPMELYHNQVTRLQGAFSLRMFHRSWGLMLIQANIGAPCTLLDFSSRDRFIQELRANAFDIVGIGAIPAVGDGAACQNHTAPASKTAATAALSTRVVPPAATAALAPPPTATAPPVAAPVPAAFPALATASPFTNAVSTAGACTGAAY